MNARSLRTTCLLALVTVAVSRGHPGELAARLQCDAFPQGRFEFGGVVGERIRANIDHWLLRAPQANPGMIEMFRLRDRQPVPQLVPWAGEFVGKYLISAIQALRLAEDERLQEQVAAVVAGFTATQAEDGYLGPFPKADRLLKNWDLWGHYHAIVALLMWHERTGDDAALAAARKAADLVCATYLDTGRRVLEAGDPEMNMAILTGLAMLYRTTGEERHLRMAREVEKDWQRAGDYLRAGLDGREFFRSPRPRWESLHDLQGLLELWRITMDVNYAMAFDHHWRSIRRWDRRNTGGFSSGEQATGNPYAPSAIETCCTVAWMALTLDYLKLTGDARAADELELSTLNGGLGAQHPSGRWWTYNTPMDGSREASAHTIVFQSRTGTPELNCCSVNAPRILGMLSEWAMMARPDGMVINSYLPGRFTLPGAPGKVVLELDQDYLTLASQRVRIVEAGEHRAKPWTLRFRMPAWSRQTRVSANFPGVPDTAPVGTYLEVRRLWAAGDEVRFHFDAALRAVAGANEAAGKVSLYRGPLLLAYDQAHNPFDEGAVPGVDLTRLAEARLTDAPAAADQAWRGLEPWMVVEVPAISGGTVRLVDFASAGARGTRYRSWLPAQPAPVAPAFTLLPPDAGRVPTGLLAFRWRGPKTSDLTYRVEFSTEEDFPADRTWTTNTSSTRLLVNTDQLHVLRPDRDQPIWWRVIVRHANQDTLADVPPAWFRIDPDAPAQAVPPEPKLGPNRELILDPLRCETEVRFGTARKRSDLMSDPDGTELNGRDQMLLYEVPAWPEEEFTVAVRVRINALPERRLGQVFSAWAAAMDDPLRLVVEGGRLHARIEAGGVFSTPGVAVETGRWYAVAAVKRAGKLSLFVDGRPVGDCAAPDLVNTQASDCALGGNPHFGGNEFLAAHFADFAFYARALEAEELGALAGR